MNRIKSLTGWAGYTALCAVAFVTGQLCGWAAMRLPGGGTYADGVTAGMTGGMVTLAGTIAPFVLFGAALLVWDAWKARKARADA